MSKDNKNLHKARSAKYDEFYTSLKDIEEEMHYYTKYFDGKTVYCNCDCDGSNFVKYFIDNFSALKLNKLIATCYNKDGFGTKLEYDGTETSNVEFISLKGNGSFYSAECLEFLEQCDIVVTNPPFSLFEKFMSTLITYDKKFIILGSLNAITIKSIFPLIKGNKIWLGVNCGMKTFEVPLSYSRNTFSTDGKKYTKLGNVVWYTNLDNEKRNASIPLISQYKEHELEYPMYDNFTAIEVSRTDNIPNDYSGVMGVPISFLTRYNPKQFKIIGITEKNDALRPLYISGFKRYHRAYIDGKEVYRRLFIKAIN